MLTLEAKVVGLGAPYICPDTEDLSDRSFEATQRNNLNVLRIYLDQAKWIDLAKFRAGHQGGNKFAEVFELATVAVAQKRASFVLSCAHYYETQKRRAGKSRANLGDTMAELSRFHAIAPVNKIVPAEIRHYLGEAPVESQIALFGIGYRHAFATNLDLMSHLEFDLINALPVSHRAQLKSIANELVERFVLAAPEDAPDAARKMFETASNISSSAEIFATSQSELNRRIDDQKLRGRLKDVAVISEIADILAPLMAECDRLGVDLDQLLGSKGSIRNLLNGLPSRWVMSELRRVRLRNPQQPWKGNDLNDLLSLSIAVPYCDVVVTERQWARHINQLGLAERFGTVVLHDLTSLPQLLARASRTDQ